MKSYVNIKDFKEDINSIDIINATVMAVEKDKEITGRDNSAARVALLTLQSGDETITANLWGKWRSIAGYISPGDKVNILHALSRDFSESKSVNVLDRPPLGFVVLEPALLMDATKMAQVAIKRNHFCFLKYHQRRVRIENVVNYYIIKGNVVGNMFDDFLVDIDNFDFDDSFKRSVEKEKIKFIGIDYIPSLKNMREEVKKDIDNLTGWYRLSGFKDHDKLIEPSFISSKYGLQGRMDILFKGTGENGSVIIELKTGRSPDEKGAAWIRHKFQLLAYFFMYESVFGDDEPESIILYSSSNDISRKIRFPYDLRRDFIFLRNKMVYYEKRYKDLDYDAMISFKRDRNDCNNCPSYLKRNCDGMYRIFSGLDEEQKDYYFSYFRAVEREKAASSLKNSFLIGDAEPADEITKKKYKISGLNLSGFDIGDSTAAFEFGQNTSELREGDTVILHTGDPEHEQLFKGRVMKLGPSSVKVGLINKYTNGLTGGKSFTLNRYDYMLSARVMLDGLYRFISGDKRFIDLILNRANPEFDSINVNLKEAGGFTLNDSQADAVKKSLCARDYFLLQGPPGTGKTKTIAFILNELIKRKQKVLLSALTNRAVDNVLIMLKKDHGVDEFLRIGNESSVSPELHDYLLTAKAAKYAIPDIKKLKAAIKGYPLIATTTTSASLSFVLDSLDFDVAVIDEASQIPEPSIFSTITRTKKFILVGDTYQLGPVIRSEQKVSSDDSDAPLKCDLTKTLFQRLWEHNKQRYDIEDDNDPCGTLDVQYRMNEQLIRFSNKKFYGDALKTDESVKNSKIELQNTVDDPHLDPERPVIFIDVTGKNAERENMKEAEIVSEIVQKFIDNGISPAEIGVISMFKAQCALIRRMIEPVNKGRELIVDTVERFQGSERDIIITSFVVSDQNALEFLKENDELNRKLNVTITRARKKLILIGNKKVLSNDPVYAELISSIESVAV